MLAELRDSVGQPALQPGPSEHEARQTDELRGGASSAGCAGTEGGEVAHSYGGVEPGAPEGTETGDATVEDGGRVVREERLRGREQLVERD